MDFNKFLIGGWQSPPPTVKQYKMLADCGLNTIFLNGEFACSDKLVAKGVSAAQKSGVAVFLEGKNDLGSPVLFNNKFTDFDCIAGVNVYDEPFFGQINDIYSVGKKVRKAYKNKAFFINLLPSYSPDPANTINSDFPLYVEKYAEVIAKLEKNGWLSFDHYPLEVSEDGKCFLSETWLNDVEAVSTIAKKYGLKPHFFIQSMSYGGSISRLHDRKPTLADLRLQFFVYLAYGAKGFTHFCYQSPVSPEFNADQTGLILNGKKTDCWLKVKKAHKEIFAFLDLYCGLSWQGCVKIKGSNSRANAFSGLDGFDFSDCRAIDSVSSSGDLLVGVLKGKNRSEGYVFTNFADTSENITVKFTVTVKRPATFTVFKNGKKSLIKVISKKTFSLGAGEGLFAFAQKI